jgi:hypothetical protein
MRVTTSQVSTSVHACHGLGSCWVPWVGRRERHSHSPGVFLAAARLYLSPPDKHTIQVSSRSPEWERAQALTGMPLETSFIIDEGLMEARLCPSSS